ncbi:peptide chain release factor N(5)-glutamine methyltransferase [Micropruina sp.]|uniref:peptide chain release factor N(5)-glutamine methyltransferase n=1 Tax=Micropruina sp. TaxID=2737536 RepID=UPI0039E5611B
MTSVTALLRAAAGRVPSADARLLLAGVLCVPPSRLLTHESVAPEAVTAFETLLTARAGGTPVQYLIGRAAFRHVEVAVGPGVFIPRPETEVMTGWALDRLHEGSAEPVVVELCAGSGAISLAIADEYPGARQHAVELSDEAVRYAAANLAGSGVALVHGDMADAFAELDGTVDLVIANPPYVPLDSFDGIPAEVRDHEPALALFSGPDGLDALRVVATVAARLLRPGGWVCAEHAELQHASAPAVFLRHGGYDQVHGHRDLNDRPRFVTARRSIAVAGWPT